MYMCFLYLTRKNIIKKNKGEIKKKGKDKVIRNIYISTAIGTT